MKLRDKNLGRTRFNLSLTSATAALFAFGSQAASQNLDLSLTSGVIGSASVTSQGSSLATTQELMGDVLSSIISGELGQGASGIVDDSSVEMNANALLANARGNIADVQGQLQGDDADGRIGLLTAQIADSAVTANVNDNAIQASLSTNDDASGSSFDASNNQLDARATVNDAQTVFSDDIAANLVDLLASDDTTISTATLTRGDFDTLLIDVDGGSNVVASSQVMTGDALDSTATASDNTISVDLLDEATDSDLADSAVSIETNQIRSGLTANRAVTATDLSIDTEFNGTGAVLSQQQIGDGTEQVDLEAASTNSVLSIDTAESLNSSMSIAGNVIGSSAAGTVALDGSAPGTVLSVDANQIDAAGGGARVFFDGDTLSLDGAFVAGTQQQIAGGGTDSSIEAGTVNTSLSVDTTDIDASSVSLERNTLFATSGGNDSGTRVQLNGTSISASAALANEQTVAGTDILADLGTTDDPSSLMANVAGPLTDGSVVLGENVFLGASDANVAGNVLSVESDTILLATSPSNAAGLSTTDEDARGAFVIGSAQSFVGADTGTSSVRTNTDTDLAVILGSATEVGELVSSIVAIDENEQVSSAEVNQVDNLLELSALTLGDTGNDNAVSSILSNRQGIDAGIIDSTSTFDAALDQTNYTTGTDALSVSDSALSVDGNENRSTASGNAANNRLTTSAEGSMVGNLATESRARLLGNFSILATSVLANEQTIEATSLDAEASTNATLDSFNGTGDEVGIDSSSLSVSDNLTAATSNANTSVSVLEQTAGTESGATAALRNVQSSDVSAQTADIDAQFTLDTRGTGANSSFAIDENRSLASATGNTANNTVKASASSFDTPTVSISDDATFQDSSVIGRARADFAVLSDQSQLGSISANVEIGAELFTRPTANTGGFLTNSSATLDNTIARAEGLANEAVNTVSVDAASDANNVTAAVASRQTSESDVSAQVGATAPDDRLAVTVRRGLSDSSMSIDGSIFTSEAAANSAQNRIEISASSLEGATLATDPTFSTDYSDLGVSIDADNDLASARSDVSIANLQRAGSETITSSSNLTARFETLDFGLLRSSASMSVSFVRSDGAANASENVLRTMSDVSANAANAVANVQESLADIDVDSTFIGLVRVGGVRILEGDDGLEASFVAIDDNISVATARANTATSSLKVEASNISGLSAASDAASAALPVPGFPNSRVVADNVVGSQQVSEGALSSNSDITARAFIRDDISLSAMSVSGNIGQSLSTANEANNELALSSDTSASGTGAVANDQTGTGTIDASADLLVAVRQDIEDTNTATPTISSSSLRIEDNLLISGAQGNNASNSLAVIGASVSGSGNATDLTIADGSITGFGTNTSDNLLATSQTRSGDTEISSSSVMTSTNILFESDDGTGTSGFGAVVPTGSTLDESSVTISGNITESSSGANRVANSIALNSDAKLSATAGLVNTQASDNPVSSDVQIRARVGNASFGDITDSSVALNGNVGVARANGNAAVNSLAALSSTDVSGNSTSAGASTSVGSGTGAVLNVAADFAMVSNQTNTGAVTATASSAAAPTQLSVNTGGGVLNSSLDLSGNTFVADASSNKSVNEMSLSGRSPSENVSVAVSNRQVATGPVTSGVNSFRVSSASGSITGSSVRVGGNLLSASAVGNTGSIGLSRD